MSNIVFRKAVNLETKNIPTLIHNPDVVFRPEDDGILLINPIDSSVYQMNQTAADIWNVCSTGESATWEIIEHLAEVYDVEQSEIEESIVEALNEMVEMGLLIIDEKKTDKNIMIHRIDTSESYILNPSMWFIWNQIDGVNSKEDIVSALVKEYDIDEEEARAETESAIQYFIDYKLTEPVY